MKKFSNDTAQSFRPPLPRALHAGSSCCACSTCRKHKFSPLSAEPAVSAKTRKNCDSWDGLNN